MATNRCRIKLYFLNEQREWEDRGTGHVSSVYVEKYKGIALLICSETDGSLLLESKIQTDTAYQKQQDTLIVWSEGENSDYALSFQKKEGCDEIWEKICQVQGKNPSIEITQDIDDIDNEYVPTSPSAALQLPPCELSRLEDIADLINKVMMLPSRREKLALAFENESYIKKLLDLFGTCESLENAEGLRQLHDIFKGLLMLNKTALYEILFRDDILMDVLGVMEYDPALPQQAKHRDFIRTSARYRQIIPFSNSELESKIHQTFRAQYIQDVILPKPSIFEENMLSALNSLIFLNKVEIVHMIEKDEEFLVSLFRQLISDETEEERRRELVLFLREFCSFSQTLQALERDIFFKTLSSFGVLGAVEFVLGLDDEQIRTAAIDILLCLIEFNPCMVREFMMKESHDDEELLINLVIEQMISDRDSELAGAMQLVGVIRLLIDPENMGIVNKTEKAEFLNFFYKHSMHMLTAPLFANTAGEQLARDDFKTMQLLALLLELIGFCIEHHSYHSKTYVVSKDLLRRAVVLLKSRHSFVSLASLRLLRKVIGLKDDFYNRYIIKGDLFRPIVDCFVANGDRYNLLNSAMLELFEFIKQENIKLLILYIVESFYKQLEGITYVNTFAVLKQRYDQQQEPLRDKLSESTPPKFVRNTGSTARLRLRTQEDDDDESWFDDQDEFDDVPAAGNNKLFSTEKDFVFGGVTKGDSGFDHINKFLERTHSPSGKESDFPPRLFSRTPGSISIKIGHTSLSPSSSVNEFSFQKSSGVANNSPSDKLSPTQQNKPFVGLVDYPDEDEDGEEEVASGDGVTDSSEPSAKRAKLVT